MLKLQLGQTLTAVMSGSAATTNPTAIVDSELTTTAVPLSGVTAVTLKTGQGGQGSNVDRVRIYNSDTAAVTITLDYVVGGTSYSITKQTLQVSDTLIVDEQGNLFVVDTNGQTKTSAVASTVDLADDANMVLGTDDDVYIRFSTGDASNPTLVLALDDTSQTLHVTDKGAVASDWNLSAGTHPTIYVHSNTTPITDYLKVGAHDGTTAEVDVVGGTTLALKIAGTTEVLITGSILDLASTNLQMQDSGQILDNSGNELLKFPAAVASAINEITVTNAAAGDAPTLSATGGDTDINLSLTPKGAGFNLSNGPFQIRSSTAVTATTGGGTTGLIPAGASLVIVTSDSVDKSISLPAATVGDRIRILVGATGCELISAVAGHKVNNVVVGATNEAALTATNLYDCHYVATNTWVVIGYTNLGAVQAALVPDALA